MIFKVGSTFWYAPSPYWRITNILEMFKRGCLFLISRKNQKIIENFTLKRMPFADQVLSDAKAKL